MKKNYSILCVLLSLLFSCSKPNETQQLASTISKDSSLHIVDSMARAVIRSGFNAGSGYSQIWARDMNTFIEVACEESNPQDLRNAILLFFALQQPNNEMIDGYVLKPEFTWNDDTPYYSDAAPDHVAFKNTVETDQESSLIQIVGKYIRKTGDKSILQEVVAGKTVIERMGLMVDYLKKERFSEKYGLIYGAMTADWGDVQPNDDCGCDINELSDLAIDVYDNAMLIIALDYLQEMTDDSVKKQEWKDLRTSLAENVRKHLWDTERQKFIPHIYLDKSPIPEGFDELAIHYHGGTAVAIEAGLLSKEEIAIANKQMVENVRLSGMPSIGLTLYPTYPEGFFRGGMGTPYVYQNGGDWTWFGGRMIQQLIANGFTEEAYDEVRPMIDRVIKNQGFYEWYGKGCKPDGSGHFKGSAGVLAKSIEMFNQWADENK
ncbi:GH36-type glycosyl hydrolase domain-containing protein [Dysgonomonas sp. ZJ279]|uniref:GH36-type glycosyl hydrolase domain-containing protein n=1 Tax=Dysgonomonas sp. ZJ279 TaxID=2709796 RepID=UPI0013EC9BBC|nr:amylo-alpha-1,6-glucosidase [Dysgonomonas sp. ZJ279]